MGVKKSWRGGTLNRIDDETGAVKLFTTQSLCYR